MKIHSLAVVTLMLAMAAGCTRLDPPASAPTTAAPSYAAPVSADVTSPESTPPKPAATYSSFDLGDTQTAIPPYMIKFQEIELRQLLKFSQELSGRTLILSPQVPWTSKVTVENATALTRTEALQMLDTALAAQQIVMVYLGTSYVKAVTAREAPTEAGLVLDRPWRQLPDSDSFIIYVAKLKTIPVEDAVSMLSAYTKMPNSLLGVKGSGVLVLRDYSSNVRRMMDILERVESSAANETPQAK